MRNLVSGERDVTILQKTRADQVAKRVVFFVEGKNRSRGDACGSDLAQGWGISGTVLRNSMQLLPQNVPRTQVDRLTCIDFLCDLLLIFTEDEEFEPFLNISLQ